MAENLNIFGETYTNVTGIKAYDTNGNIQTYIKPEGNISITRNSASVDVSQYATASVNVTPPTPNYQSKTVNPTSSQQVVTADNGYDALSSVTVTAVPTPSYQSKTVNPTTSQQTVTADSGYDALSQVTVNAMPTTTHPNPSISVSSSGLITATHTQTTGYVTGGTTTDTEQLTTKARATITPGTTNQTIASGTYLTGTQTISGDSNLVARNIKEGVSIFGVTGTFEGGGSVNIDTKTATASNYPTSISFTGMLGQPRAFFLRSTAQISSSGSTTYYYIIDMRYNGTNTTGNYFRIGSTRATYNATSGYSFTYSGTTLTITSSATSRSATPGAFNNTYELVYVY